MAPALGESITVVNKSGKIVSTSKHLVNVFKEARSAYLERKAELKAERDDDLQRKTSKRAIESGHRSSGSSRNHSPHRHDSSRVSSRDHGHSRRRSSSSAQRDSRHRDSRHRESRHRDSKHRDSRHRESRGDDKERKSSIQRVHSDSFYANDRHSPNAPRRTSTQPISPSHLRQSHGPEDDASSRSPSRADQQLIRRHSDSETRSLQDDLSRRRSPHVSSDDEEIDMDLAYGELPPPLPIRPEEEIRNKMTTLTRLLEEANCVEHSVRAVIKNLEENPDAMAAVALTLAEISNLATKMAPGALASLKGSFPVVVALLASPEFLIGGGVAIGVTIVVFGGYKIVKRIKAKRDLEKDEKQELEEITSEVSRIESWRRGIQPEDLDAISVGTSVEGEFITPKASMQLREEGVLSEKKDKSLSSKKEKSDKAAAAKEEKKAKKAEKESADKAKKEEKSKADKAKKETKLLEKQKDGDKESSSGLKSLFKRDKEVVLA